MAKKVQGVRGKASRRSAESAVPHVEIKNPNKSWDPRETSVRQTKHVEILRDFYFEHNSVKFGFRAGDVWELVDEYPGDPREKKVARQVLVEFQDEGIFKAV